MPDSQPTRGSLRSYIRYQLSQLSSRNGQHEFERLAYDLARIRVASNLLPATGPVQAGGDQGRDFESYRTFLASSPLSSATFIGNASRGMITGACTLDKRIVRKIKSDLSTIFAHGERPTHVAYFCEPDIPIAKRHVLQSFCTETYGATLDIFDGNTIADMLADADARGVAFEHLEIPSELWPAPGTLDAEYSVSRTRWLSQQQRPLNWADFFEIKLGLRTATFNEEAKPDLPNWIATMRTFLDRQSPPRMAQKARYEVSVAELRGQGSLDPALPLVTEFFANISGEAPAIELLDAAVLTAYAHGATSHGQASIARTQLAAWLTSNDAILAAALETTTSNADRALLLEARAMIAILPRPTDSSPDGPINRFLEAWEQVVTLVETIPIYPITPIADIFEKATELLRQPNERLRNLIQRVDALIAERAGKNAAAERARNRAALHLEAGRRLQAIDELHNTRVYWFSAETIDGSILAMLLLSKCYQQLGLHFAARYYAAGALFTCLFSDISRTGRLVSTSAFQLAETYYVAGEWISYVHMLSLALEGHHQHAADAGDWTKHSHVSDGVGYALVLRAASRKLAPHLTSIVDAAMEGWPMDRTELEEMKRMSESPPWSDMSSNEIEAKIASELGHAPFSDVGPDRCLTWRALGLSWEIRFAPGKDSYLAALELAAAIQIVQVEFAELDLVIIPSTATIEVVTDSALLPQCAQLPDNKRLAWRVSLPAAIPDATNDDYRRHVVGAVIMVLSQAAALSAEKLESAIRGRFERGLVSRIFSARPPRELFSRVQVDSLDFDELARLQPPNLALAYLPQETPELAWLESNGPGYTPDLGLQYVRNRYATTLRGLSRTLPRIIADPRCRELLLRFRANGVLDWQLLTVLLSIVAQVQVQQSIGRPATRREDLETINARILREESNSDAPFDLELLTEERLRLQLDISLVATLRTWDLACRQQTPDFVAVKRLLDVRYHHSLDDVPHSDPLDVTAA